jgi:hypothetical protein
MSSLSLEHGQGTATEWMFGHDGRRLYSTGITAYSTGISEPRRRLRGYSHEVHWSLDLLL